jgi:hypothetical protein
LNCPAAVALDCCWLLTSAASTVPWVSASRDSGCPPANLILTPWHDVAVHLKPASISAEIGYSPPDVDVVLDSASVLLQAGDR